MRLYIPITCGLLSLTGAPLLAGTSPYHQEIKQQLTSLQKEEFFCPHNGLEKIFFDIFSFATTPYTQPVRRVAVESCPQLHELVCKLSKEYAIEKPQLFLACDQAPGNIDIKLCTFNTASALLLHPGTVAALSGRVFERYLEQALSRIQATILQFKEQLNTRKNQRMGFLITLPLIVALTAFLTHRYANQEGKEKYFVSLGCGLSTGAYALLLYRSLTKRYAGFSFQRISSFHNDEQAREDFFPAPTKDKRNQLTEDPDELFGINAITQTQNYLKTRNEEFRIRD